MDRNVQDQSSNGNLTSDKRINSAASAQSDSVSSASAVKGMFVSRSTAVAQTEASQQLLDGLFVFPSG